MGACGGAQDFTICTQVLFENLGGSGVSFFFQPAGMEADPNDKHAFVFDSAVGELMMPTGSMFGDPGGSPGPGVGAMIGRYAMSQTWHDVTFIRCGGNLSVSIDRQ
eukprot:3319707-Rhodomonas_salina.2